MLNEMRVDSVTTGQILTQAMAAPQATKDAIQVATLKKALDSQKEEAAELLKQMQPKGRLLDIRV